MLYKGGTFLEVVNSIWSFFQDQILGMKWLNGLIGKGLSQLGLDIDSRLGGSIQFFLYDVIKITILLCLLIFFISYIQSYFPPERSKKILGRFHGIGANIISALLGTVTPFCSCSSIPLFIGFTSAGLPLGVTFSFLISSPMVDLGSLVLLMSIFGAKVAFAYVIVGLIIAVIGGTFIENLHMEKYVEDGKIRSIGLSNWYVEELEEFLPQIDITPALVQNEIHPYYQENDVIPYIQNLGIVVQGWYPFGGRGHTSELLGNETIVDIAKEHGVSAAQVILRWNLQKGVVVIPGSSNPEHIKENTEIYDFELTNDQMDRINALDRNEKHDWY